MTKNIAQQQQFLHRLSHDIRPVWLFSMDSEQFYAAPTTTGGLKAYYQRYGQKAGQTSIELFHFRDAAAIPAWKVQWQEQLLDIANTALENGLQPIAGFSFYTWNAEHFLELISFLKQSCPGLLILAGGPHVQQPEDYLHEDPIDVIAMGEAETTFQELLDAEQDQDWFSIAGLAFVDAQGKLHRTPARKRRKTLDELPSAFGVVPLCDEQGKAIYDSVSYETSRGCPFSCAFCEWGTGAIGGKMFQFSLERVRHDFEHIVASGIKDIWLADSNFGALKEDLEKARIICDLKQQTGLPLTFATSWSKKHSPRVQEIVLMLNRNKLLPHYQLALQTLTPLALELSNRQNMSSNKYEPIAKEMASQGVPIAAELIWGLPGDNLADFERNLDQLLATFPKINIFGYTLLPGTEFYEKRHEYQLEAIPVAGYGKAKGEYVVGCHTFSRDEGMEGYFLITAHIILNHGYLIPMTIRLLALEGSVPVSAMLRVVLATLIAAFKPAFPQSDANGKISIYENRAELYIALLQQSERCFDLITRSISDWLLEHQASPDLISRVHRTLLLDRCLCPRTGAATDTEHQFDFLASQVHQSLEAMEMPAFGDLQQPQTLSVHHPGGVGDILKDPDGGSWLKGSIIKTLDLSTQHPGQLRDSSMVDVLQVPS